MDDRHTALDTCTTYEQGKIEVASRWLDNVMLLGSSLDAAQMNDPNLNISANFAEEVAKLNYHAPIGTVINFRGPGLTWTIDGMGRPATIYKDRNFPVVGSAAIKGVLMARDEDLDYDCGHCSGKQMNLLMNEDASVLVDDSHDEECNWPQLSDDLKIYLELEHRVSQSDEADINVVGSCINTDFLSFRSLLIASEVTIELINPEVGEDTTVEEDKIPDVLGDFSRQVKSLVRDTAYRRLSTVEQYKKLEEIINQANSCMDLPRFSADIFTDTFYAATVQHGLRSVQLAAEDSAYKSCIYQASVDLIRVDSLESYNLSESRAIRHNNDLIRDDTSLFLVCRVKPEHKKELGFDTDIVWIPIPVSSSKHSSKKRGNKIPQPIFEIEVYERDVVIEQTHGN